MGGGSPSLSSDEDDDTRTRFRYEHQRPWPPLVAGLGVENSDLETSSWEKLAPGAAGSAIVIGDLTKSNDGSREPGILRSVESEGGRNYFDAFQSGEIDVFHGDQKHHGRESLAVPEIPLQRGFNTRAEETVQDVQLSEKLFSDLQKPFLAPTTTISSQRTRETLPSNRRRIFKLMQIENDKQDLSFVEKVILSQDEIFSLCNNIAAESAKVSEGRRIMDFGSLNSKSMKVVGFFGSKDVMREIFQDMKCAQEGDFWMQIQNDTLAPGLYAWLHDNSLFVFYWHQGRALPGATRKDMSCNFIRYIFDLCDTVCVCLEAKNFKDSLFHESAPRFSKRQRTQRLQMSLVKASEDGVKVTAGFLLEGLPLGRENGLPAKGRSQKGRSQKNASFNWNILNYKLSEGLSRVALLVSSTRPRKLSSVKSKEEMNVTAFPAFIGKWTVGHGYSLDLKNLSDSDFIVFIRCAKLRQADDFDGLVASYAKRREEEKNKIYTVDKLVEEEQEQLSRCLESFIYAFLRIKYPWEERLMLVNSSAYLPMTPENPSANLSKTRPSQQSRQALSDLFSDPSVNLSSASDSEKLESCPPHAAEAQEVTQDRLNQLENDIYDLLLGKNSKQRMIFPFSAVYMYNPSSQRLSTDVGEQRFAFTTFAGPNVNSSSKFAPIYCGNKVALWSASKLSAPLMTGTIHRYKEDGQGPLLTNEDCILKTSGGHLRIKLELVRRTGDLSMSLNLQAGEMGYPRVWRRAVLLTAISEKLAESRLQIDLTGSLARETLASENPLDKLHPVLPKPGFEFARRKWEELQGMKTPASSEVQQMTIAEGLQGLCLDLYKTFRSNLQSRIPAQIRRFTTSLLNQKFRKQCSDAYDRLEATLKEEEVAFLASQKDVLSRRTDRTDPLTLTVEACKLMERPGGWRSLMPWAEDGQNISISLVRHEFEKESITWHGLELAPMKEDLDKLIIDNEYTFSPSCSASKEIIDLDPSRQQLLRVVFLKAGQLLVFIVEGLNDPKDLMIYLCPKLSVKLSPANCIQKLKRGFDLIAFDERSRFVAFYDGSISTIKTFRFDEAFRHMDWTGVDITLGEYKIGRLIWMEFVTGKNEIVFIDDLYRVRLCEVSQPGMVRSGNVHVGQAPIVKACVTTQGSCLLLLRQWKSKEPLTGVSVSYQKTDNESQLVGEPEGLDTPEIIRDSVHLPADRPDTQVAIAASLEVEEQCLVMDVYKLDDSIQHLSSMPLDVKVTDWSKLEVGLTSFSSQMHLVIFNSESPSILTSKVIKISSATEVCQLQQVTRSEVDVVDTERNPETTQSGPVLDYIYQIFEKYATSPPLIKQSRELRLHMVLKHPVTTYSDSISRLSDNCKEYVITCLDRLKRDKGKDFSALQIQISVQDVEKFQRTLKDLPWSIDEGSRAAPAACIAVQIGVWIRRLVCLVPIQISRAEHNALQPMADGLQLSGNVDYVDAISLAKAIRFGLYEAVFDTWTGPVKVISSMGKQSSGKSYLLNHLSGSLLDVAGGRCTDGVWMSLREGDGCLYVLLDFEGLGSFERSEQEDMLLSLLNAAISNLTIFNKKDFHLDKETEAIFERFQNGVSLVKTDAKLFRGLFYMAIKDVDISDVEDLKNEFFSKISQICSKSQDNFLTRMYGGSIEISAMPSFNRPEFHESIADIARTVEELEASYLSGRSFLLDLKLIIAQISTKDWSPIDSKRVALRIDLLKKYLISAVGFGCLFSDGISKPLIQFDNHVEIPDQQLIVSDDNDFPIRDTELELTPFEPEKKVTGDILLSLMGTFRTTLPRNGERDEEWHSSLEKFISALVLRRKRRVLEWIVLNTSDFPNDGDIQKLQLEAVALLAEVQQNLLLCSCKCERCFLRCVQEKGHPSTHSCMGDHRCVAMCTYCLDEESILGAGPCNDVAGHDGPHDCHEKNHTCGECCIYAETSSNCNGNCSKRSGHTGEHQCNSRLHTCNQVCSLPSCKNPCVSAIDIGDHEIHACHEKFCPVRCTMKGCNRTCATEDHFHGMNLEATHHFCGSEHPCGDKCGYKGNCEILTEVSKKTQTFTGQRATFDYVLVSEQNGNRKGCCIVIPPHKDRHEGPHSHSSNANVVHFCETRCPSCGYFCTRPMEHGGLHSTTHGNMRGVNFVAESEEIDILDRKYAWGESGVAEMCQMHCKAQGRGHIHLIHCPANTNDGACRKLFDGAQHEMRKYGPDFNIAKDEMTHAAYWEYVRFEDPCSIEEKKLFSLCNHQCKSEEHIPRGADTSAAVRNFSYCTERLWHQPIPKTDLMKSGTGYITDDGHHFSCDHSTNVAVNVIFVIDRSSSMGARDITPSMTKFSSSHGNRLGCVFEAILRFIRTRLSYVKEDIASVVLFNDTAKTVISLQEMKESLVDKLLKYSPKRRTNYSTGLEDAERVLSLATADARLSRKSPVIIFLSDGGDWARGSNPVDHIAAMKALDPRLQLHTIMFGKDPYEKILKDMAEAGDGTFEVSLDEVQLSRRFEGLAKSLRPQVASLL